MTAASQLQQIADQLAHALGRGIDPLQVDRSLLAQHKAALVPQGAAETRDVGQRSVEVVGNREAERLQLGVQIGQGFDAGLQRLIQAENLLFRLALPGHHLAQLSIPLLEHFGVVLDLAGLPRHPSKHRHFGAEDLRHHRLQQVIHGPQFVAFGHPFLAGGGGQENDGSVARAAQAADL